MTPFEVPRRCRAHGSNFFDHARYDNPATAGSKGICSWTLRTSQHLGIARNILAARLKRLVEHGLLEKRQYEMYPPRFEYHLTRKGLDLQPVLIGLMQWGDRYVADASGGPVVLEHRACGHPVRAVARCGRSPGAKPAASRSVRATRLRDLATRTSSF